MYVMNVCMYVINRMHVCIHVYATVAGCLPDHELGVSMGWGGVITYVALALSLTCYATCFVTT